jgi:hypothetical protein
MEPFFFSSREPKFLLSAALPVFPRLVRIYRAQALKQTVGVRLRNIRCLRTAFIPCFPLPWAFGRWRSLHLFWHGALVQQESSHLRRLYRPTPLTSSTKPPCGLHGASNSRSPSHDGKTLNGWEPKTIARFSSSIGVVRFSDVESREGSCS